MNTVEIRLELLKKQGEGYSKAETVKHLTEKYHISCSAGYYHFETMDKWIGNYFDFKNVAEFQFNIMNQFNTINREASFLGQHAKDDNAKIGYMRVRLEALSKLAEFSGFNMDKAIDPTTGKVIQLHMWRPGDPASDDGKVVIRLWNENRDTTKHIIEVVDPDNINLSNLTPEETEILDKASRVLQIHSNDKMESLH